MVEKCINVLRTTKKILLLSVMIMLGVLIHQYIRLWSTIVTLQVSRTVHVFFTESLHNKRFDNSDCPTCDYLNIVHMYWTENIFVVEIDKHKRKISRLISTSCLPLFFYFALATKKIQSTHLFDKLYMVHNVCQLQKDTKTFSQEMPFTSFSFSQWSTIHSI